jgi:hypothetical protein
MGRHSEHQMRTLLIVAMLLAVPSAGVGEDSPSSIFQASETAGIRRRSDVVSTSFQLNAAVTPKTNFRLLRNGDPIPAQFFVGSAVGSSGPTVFVDFVDNFGPFEKREYRIEQGEDVTPLTRKSGFRLRETDEAFVVSNRDAIEWTIRKDLKGLFTFDHLTKELTYVSANSTGLFFRLDSASVTRFDQQKPDRILVVRTGPVASALRFEYDNWPPGRSSSLDLEFFATKSWVYASWQIGPGLQALSELGAELQLELTGREKLIDFAGGDFVYTTVRNGQVARLQAGPRRATGHVPWGVFHDTSAGSLPFVVSHPEAVRRSTAAAGWAHVMDDTRCSAISIDEFAEGTEDRIEIDHSGRLTLGRRIPDGSRLRTDSAKFEFAIHFVSMPVHIGARTSPQAMAAPIEVTWRTEESK